MRRGGQFLRNFLVFFAVFLVFFVFASGISIFGTIGLIIGNGIHFTIDSPKNTTYFFNKTELYLISLNVSATSKVDNWSYDLKDLKHNLYVVQGEPFTPNTTFIASRWSNLITVYANDSNGASASINQTFFVSVPNSAPIIENLPDQLYVCENNYLYQTFDALDVDESILSYNINPTDPFFITPFASADPKIANYILFSKKMIKSYIKNYIETVSVSDGQYSDSKNLTITGIEINNPPYISPLTSQTINVRRGDQRFYKKIIVTDVESGNQDSGNLTFSIDFLQGNQIFNVSQNGTIDTIVNSSEIGVYLTSICVKDLPLKNISPNIVICNDDGLSKTTCANFSLTITDVNRPPTIISYFPNSPIYAVDGETIKFNITTYDPDGTMADIYWYVDGSMVKSETGSLIGNLDYTFGCGIGGPHMVTANITDGIDWDSNAWTVNVNETACPASIAGANGGGGSSGGGCSPLWACGEWNNCKNLQKALGEGIIFGKDFRIIEQECKDMQFNDSSCGAQTRSCTDLRNCNSTINLPNLTQFCQFSENPSCNDKIKNCHDGSCEVGIDCGGPCRPCPTCSDGIQNQGETGIDCGGPCIKPCPSKTASLLGYIFAFITSIPAQYLYIILILLACVIIAEFIRVIVLMRKLKSKTSFAKADNKMSFRNSYSNLIYERMAMHKINELRKEREKKIKNMVKLFRAKNLTATVAGVFFIFSLLFIVPNLTGFSVFDSGDKISLQFGLLLLALSAIFFYLTLKLKKIKWNEDDED